MATARPATEFLHFYDLTTLIWLREHHCQSTIQFSSMRRYSNCSSMLLNLKVSQTNSKIKFSLSEVDWWTVKYIKIISYIHDKNYIFNLEHIGFSKYMRTGKLNIVVYESI